MGYDAHVLEGFESGADDYVVKPVSYKQLATRILVIMQRRSDAGIVDSSLVANWRRACGPSCSAAPTPASSTRRWSRNLVRTS
jgi:DNA-binding response OmpR family regulator